MDEQALVGLRRRVHSLRRDAWAMVEDDGSHRRNVVGVDAGGQWPGGDDNEPGWDFVRYVYEPLDAGQPDDLFNPIKSPTL